MPVNALIASGLVLFVITFVVNFAARWIVGRSEREAGPIARCTVRRPGAP